MSNQDYSKDKFKSPNGIGGWLLIPLYLMILQVYNFTIKYIPNVVPSDCWCYFNPNYNVFNPALGVLCLMEIVIMAILTAWSVLCVYLILKKSRAVRTCCSRFFLFTAGYTVLDNILTVVLVPDSRLFSDLYSGIALGVSIINPVIWGVYFLKSERVTRTFGASSEGIPLTRFYNNDEALRSKRLFRRFFARILDISLVMFLLILLRRATSPLHETISLEYVILKHARWLIVCDLLIYALFKQTLGKKLFGLRVVRNDGQSLTRKQYMFRSGNALFFLCWPLWLLYTIGMKHFNYFALLAILLLLGTIGFQYRKALDYGRTSYDSVYDTQVNAVPLTPKQIIVAIFSVVSSFALLIAVVRA